MHYSERIIEEYESEESSKYIYKLKSENNTEYYKVLDYFRKKAKWLVYSLSSDDPLNTLITELKKEITNKSNTRFYLEEAELSEMIEIANKRNINILIGLEDIKYTHEMVQFLSIWESLLLEGNRNIYLLTIGLSENIKALSYVSYLNFFRRGDSFEA